MADRMVDAKTVAKTLGCSPETVRKLARDGDIPGAKVGRIYRFDVQAVVLSLSLSQGSQGQK